MLKKRMIKSAILVGILVVGVMFGKIAKADYNLIAPLVHQSVY